MIILKLLEKLNMIEIKCLKYSEFWFVVEVSLVDGWFLLEEVLDSISISVSFKINRAWFGTLGVEFKSGVSSDFKTVNFVGSSVEFSNDEVWDILEFSGNLVPDGRKLFAVTAPGSVEFNKNVLVVI